MSYEVRASFSPAFTVVDAPTAIYRGMARKLRVEATADGAPLDFSAAEETRFTLRRSVDDGDSVLVSKTGAVDGGITSPAPGVVVVALDQADTLGLSDELHVWDLWATIDGEPMPVVVARSIEVLTGAYVPEEVSP